MFGKKTVNPLSRYTDPTHELPNRELSAAEWYIRHKEQMKRLAIGILLAWSAVTIGFSLWRWADYLFFGYATDERMLLYLRAAPNYEVQHGKVGAAPLLIGAIDVFETTAKKYDIAALAKNPNERWVATVTYAFVTATGETALNTITLLPGAEHALIAFGYESGEYPAAPQLKIVATRWQRVNPHAIPDAGGYMALRLKFPVSNVEWKPADPGSGRTVPALSFDIQNDTAYSYWQPVFYVALKSGSEPVGYLYLTFDQFKAGETRSVTHHLLSDRVSVSGIDVVPVINVFDPSVSMPPDQASASHDSSE